MRAWFVRLGLVLLILGVVCRLYIYLLAFPIWRDEASLALNFAARDFRGLLGELDNYQVAPLLFLWIEKVVYQYLGGSPALLRLIPLLAGIAGLLIFHRLARWTLSPLAAALAGGCLAVASSPIHLSSMIKPYSLDLCLATLLLTLAVGYLRAVDGKGFLIALTALIPFVVAASYPVVFIAGSVSLVLLPMVWRRGGLGWWAAFNALCIAAFAAHLHFVGREISDPEPPAVQPFMAVFWKGAFLPHEPLAALHWLVRCHVGHMLSYPLEWNGGGLLGLILVVIGGLALYRQGQGSVLALCLLPFALNLAAAAIHRYPYAGDQRLEQHLVPGLCLLIGSGIADIIVRLARSEIGQMRWATGVAGLLLIVALAGAVRDTLWPCHDAEATWARDIARHLQRELRPEDRIILCRPSRNIVVCVRWHLLPFAERICSPTQIDWAGLERSGGRLWLLDQVLVQASPAVELPRCDPREMLPEMDRHSWNTIRRMRFLTHTPGERERQVYHHCCDLHVLRPRTAAELVAASP